MERNHKRRSFMKSIFGRSKPHAPGHSSSRVKPSPPNQVGHVDFYKESSLSPSPMPKTFSAPTPRAFHVSTGGYEYQSDHGGDENVDMKAANYISIVRERLKLVNVESDHRMYQEMR